MSNALTMARPYARAAFSVARQHDRLPAWSAMLQFAAQVAADPRVRNVIGHPKAETADVVALLSPPDVDGPFADFLGVLADNGRLALLPEIAAQYEELRADAERVVHARVTAAKPIEAAELDRIKDALKRRFGRDVQVETAVDETLIGGAVIDAGEVVIDGSVRGKLARLQTAIAH